MKCVVKIHLRNDDYSQAYADEHNQGEESEMNRKFDWVDELAITTPVENVVEIENGSYTLQGQLEDGTSFQFDIPHMHLIQITSMGQPDIWIGASNKLVEKSVIQIIKYEYNIEIVLKDKEPFSNPVPGIYICAHDFPEQLIR